MRSCSPSRSSSSPSTATTPAPDEAHVIRERALREREEDGECSREQRGHAQLAGDRRVSTDQREAAPGEPEPQVGVESSAEELEVVGQDEEDPERHEQHEPRLVRERRRRRRSRTRPRPRRRRGRRGSGSGMPVRSGRPFSSSSACAPIPTASPNATTAAPRRPHATTGARQPPITTYERCHAVYGRWRRVA